MGCIPSPFRGWIDHRSYLLRLRDI